MQDLYFKKYIDYKFLDLNLKFAVANEIFSTFRIDIGTALLLRTFVKTYKGDPHKILDLGCGYGPIGITLAKMFPYCKVEMIDKDLLAVRYAQINSELNKVDDRTEIHGELGIENLKLADPDLVFSNIPAKAGDAVIREVFIKQLYNQLGNRGEYWCVVVSGLNRLIPKISRAEQIPLKLVIKRKGHSVYKALKVY
jgi:16S rRNA (guanine1207-N2)-methyltransferase